jgi:hypothetical protein
MSANRSDRTRTNEGDRHAICHKHRDDRRQADAAVTHGPHRAGAGAGAGVAMSTTAAATGEAPRSKTAVAAAPQTCHGKHGNLRFAVVGEESARTIPGLDVPGYLEAVGRRKLYAPSSGSSEILVLNADGDVIRRWGEPGTGPGQFGFLRNPADPDSALGGVAVARSGAVYVAEAANRRIQRFTAAGMSDLIWGSSGIGPGQFLDPIGVASGPRETCT